MFTSLPLYFQGKSLRCPLDRSPGGPQSRSRRCRVEKNFLSLPEIEPRPSRPYLAYCFTNWAIPAPIFINTKDCLTEVFTLKLLAGIHMSAWHCSSIPTVMIWFKFILNSRIDWAQHWSKQLAAKLDLFMLSETYIFSFFHGSTAFFGSWPLFQFLNPIYSLYDSLDGGSDRCKAATYAQNNTNIE
jgi:hypothetical protein